MKGRTFPLYTDLLLWGQKSNWCASGSSKPEWGGSDVPGGFDSHMSPPEKSLGGEPDQKKRVCTSQADLNRILGKSGGMIK